MTTVAEIQDLAAELQDLRPDWPDIIPIVNHLLPWRHLPYHQLRYLTTGWVQDHKNRTPASLKYMLPVPPQPAGGSSPKRPKEPRCYICGKYQSDCIRARDFEIANNIPDPHVFETETEATTNAAPRTPAQRAELNTLIRGLIRSVNEELAKPAREPWLPPDLAAESAARLEADNHHQPPLEEDVNA